MLILDMEQDTPEWLAWRKTVITATDCPAILGSSPWSTLYKCWQKKLGLIPEQPSNAAMERGKRLEPIARAQFISRFGIEMVPKVVESSDCSFLGASLDGLSACGEFVLEIKCGGLHLHTQASQGIIPEYYMDQMQHQLLVTGAQKAFYYSYNGVTGICIDVLPDASFKAKFMPIAKDFWRAVAYHEEPALVDADYEDMSSDASWIAFASHYKSICKELAKLEEIKETYRQDLLRVCNNRNCKGDGIKVRKSMPKGRVAYDLIPELEGVDLDKYRKPSSACWKIFVS